MALLKIASSRSKGFEIEKMAKRYLSKHAIEIIAQQYHSRFGEIDLIGTNDNSLLFIEVRFRKNNHYGTPIETVTQQKQRKIIKTAYSFLSKNKKFQTYDCRFDIIGVTPYNMSFNFNWIKGAFTE